MAPNFDSAVSNLLCAEDNSFDDIDFGSGEFNGTHHHQRSHDQNRGVDYGDDDEDGGLALQCSSDEYLGCVIENEAHHLPRLDYLMRLQNGDLNVGSRTEAVDWILKGSYLMGESNCNWQEDEKVQLCDSWARVTVCPITGKSISLSKLWEKIFNDYMENWCGPTNRTPSALQSQFRHLKKMLKDWHNAQIQTRNNIASGHNLMDQMNQAQTIYMKHHPKEFDKWACWEKVKHHPYFADPPSKTRASDSPSTNEHPLDLDNDEVMETTPC